MPRSCGAFVKALLASVAPSYFWSRSTSWQDLSTPSPNIDAVREHENPRDISSKEGESSRQRRQRRDVLGAEAREEETIAG